MNLVDETNSTMLKRHMVPFRISERKTFPPPGCRIDSIAARRTKGSRRRRRFAIAPIGSLDKIRNPVRRTAMIA
jgi:hypothetical protein